MSLGFVSTASTECRTIQQLLKSFYKFHSHFRKGVRSGLNPIAFVLNPEQLNDPSNVWTVDRYFAVYYRKYFVVIEQNTNSPYSGPHAAKLYYEVYGPTPYYHAYRVHLGTIQVCCNFFSKVAIRKALRGAIAKRRYFASEDMLETVIEFDEPDATYIEV